MQEIEALMGYLAQPSVGLLERVDVGHYQAIEDSSAAHFYIDSA